MESNNQIVEVIASSNVEVSTAMTLQNSFQPFFEQAKVWEEKARAIFVTDPTQITEMKEARDLRLKLQKIRTGADKTREDLKRDSLNYSKAVQAVYNLIESFIKPLEQHLEKQEKYAENLEKQRQEELRAIRTNEIALYIQYIPPFGDLGKMAQFEFDRLIDIAKQQKQIAEEAERKSKEEADEKARKEAEERETMRKENERLQAEAKIAREAQEKAEAEKREIEAKAKKEREESEKKVREAQEKAEAERKAKEEQDRKIANAPDVEKLMMLALKIDSIDIPDVSGEDAKNIINAVKTMIAKTSNYIREKSSSI